MLAGIHYKIQDAYRKYSRSINSNEANARVNSVSCSSQFVCLEHANELRQCVVSVSGNGRNFVLFDCESGKIYRRVELSRGVNCVIRCVAISAAVATSSSVVAVVAIPPPPILVVGLENGFVYLFELMTGLQLYLPMSNIHQGGPITCCMVYEEDHRSILLVCTHNECQVWEFETYYRQACLNDSKSALLVCIVCFKPKSSLHSLPSYDSESSSFASPSQTSVIVTCNSEGYIFTYHITSCKLKLTWRAHPSIIYALTSYYQPSTEQSYIISGGLDAIIRIWYSHDGQLVQELIHHEGPVHCLATIKSNDKSFDLLASGGFDRHIRLWDLQSFTLLFVLCDCHEDLISSIRLSIVPFLLVVSGSFDGQTKVWDLEKSHESHIQQFAARMTAQPIREPDDEQEGYADE